MIALGVLLIVLPILVLFASIVRDEGWGFLCLSIAFTAALCVPIAAGTYLLSVAGVVQ